VNSRHSEPMKAQKATLRLSSPRLVVAIQVSKGSNAQR